MTDALLLGEHPRMRAAHRQEVIDLLPSATSSASSHSWLSPRRVAIMQLSLSVGATTSFLSGPLTSNAWQRVLCVLIGGAASAIGAIFACRSTTTQKAHLRSLGVGVAHAIFMIAVVLPTFLLLNDQRHDVGHALQVFSECGTGALFIGAPAGVLFGLVHSVLPYVVADLHQKPSHANLDRVLTVGALWLLLVAMIHWFVIELSTLAVGSERPSIVLVLAWVFPLIASVASILLLIVRKRARARFINAVFEGRNKEFRIVRRSRAWERVGILPFERGVRSDLCTLALVHIGRSPSDMMSYRTQAEREVEDRVVALLP